MRLTARNRISKAAETLELNKEAKELLFWLLDQHEYGVVLSIANKKWDYIEAFEKSLEVFYRSLQTLIDYGFVEIQVHDLKILVCSDIYLTNLVHKSLKKRVYIKNPSNQHVSIIDMIRKGFKDVCQKVTGIDDIKMNFLIEGIKIASAYRPYLSSELLTESELNNKPENYKYFLFDNNYDSDYLALLEEERRNLTKEEKRLLTAILYMSINGKIRDYRESDFIKAINNNFGGGFFQTTVNDAMKKLQELWFIHIEDGILHVKFYKDSFGKGKNYVVIPDIVLKKAFKKLSAGAIKAFFQFMFQLNNGETADKYGNIESEGQKKAIYFKVQSLSTETDDQKARFINIKRWLKRRTSREILNVLLGINLGSGDYTSLAEYFDFHLLDNGALQIRVNRKYYISKKDARSAITIDPKKRYYRKAKVVEEVLQEVELQITEPDELSLIRIFRSTGRRTIKVLVQYLADRMKVIEIQNIGGYMTTIYQAYQNGTFKELYKQTRVI